MPRLIIKTIVTIARVFNSAYYLFSKLQESLIRKSSWVQELARYFKTSPEAVISQYHQKRPKAAQLWGKKKRNTKAQIQSFYNETDYFIYRQKYFHRHQAYFDIALPLLLKRKGKFCEYGSGIGPVTHWLIRKFPDWHYHLTDLNCPVFKFAQWRFKSYPNVSFRAVTLKKLPLKDNFDVIVCQQVLEHVSNPLAVVKHQIAHLKSGGWLYLDFIYGPGEENLEASARQRRKVLSLLKTDLEPLFAIDPDNLSQGYGLYRKPL